MKCQINVTSSNEQSNVQNIDFLKFSTERVRKTAVCLLFMHDLGSTALKLLNKNSVATQMKKNWCGSSTTL